MNNDRDIIYIDLVQYNSSTENQVINIQRIYDEVILKNANEYQMSIVRFDFYGIILPIINLQNYFINNTPPTTVMQVKLTYNATDFIVPITWVPFSTPPSFNYYDYNHFTRIVNNALTTATANLNTVFPATITIPPRVEYDPLTTRFVLYGEQAVFTDTLPNPVILSLSNVLGDLMHSLPYNFFETGSPSFFRMSFREIFGSNATNNSKIVSGVPCWAMIQEYQSLSGMNSAKSIVLTSDLPIVEEYINSIGNEFSGGNTSTIQLPIVSDFILNAPNGYDIFNYVVYQPTAEYRMISLSGSRPIQSINMKMFYQDANGILTPLLLPPKKSINIKLMFRKKGWNNQK